MESNAYFIERMDVFPGFDVLFFRSLKVLSHICHELTTFRAFGRKLFFFIDHFVTIHIPKQPSFKGLATLEASEVILVGGHGVAAHDTKLERE